MNRQIILITGTSSGFGQLSAFTAARQGHTVYASMRNVESKNSKNVAELMNQAKEEKLHLHTIELDVTKEETIKRTVDFIIKKEGKIDVLVNNAGAGTMGILEDTPLESVKNTFEVNLFGVFSVTKAVVPHMKAQGEGLIINLSSAFGRTVLPLFEIYCASKYALEALSEGWRYELSPLGIDSVIVEPGAYPTTKFMENVDLKISDAIEAYGPLQHLPEGFAKTFEESIKNGTANDPQLVADVIVKLIETEPGKRPLRTIVDPGRDSELKKLNAITDSMEKQMLEGMHIGDLFSVHEH